MDITSSQMSVLFVVSKGKEVNQKKLGDVLNMDKSTVTRNLKRLFEKEWISKKGAHLVMTEQGLIALENILPAWQAAMVEIKSILGEDGQESLNTVVNKLKV